MDKIEKYLREIGLHDIGRIDWVRIGTSGERL
jgi:hypothetical protein